MSLIGGKTVTNWVCSECGREGAKLNEARPSVDDRYAIGYCESCCPLPVIDPNDHQKTKPRNRRVVQLVRSDLWSPDLLAERRRQARIRQLFNGKGPRSAADIEEMAAIRRQWESDAEARRSA